MLQSEGIKSKIATSSVSSSNQATNIQSNTQSHLTKDAERSHLKTFHQKEEEESAEVSVVEADRNDEVICEVNGVFPDQHQVQVTCGSFSVWVLAENPSVSQTAVGLEVYHSVLISQGKSDAQAKMSDTLSKLRNKVKKKVELDSRVEEAYGPFILPMRIDGIWVYQSTMLLANLRLRRKIYLGPQVFGVHELQVTPQSDGDVKQSQVHLDADSRVKTRVKCLSGAAWTPMMLLIDTGATVNVANELFWEKNGKPTLTPFQMNIMGVDLKTLDVMGVTPLVKVRM